MHSSASEAKDSWMFWSKVPGQAPLPQLKVAQQREVSPTFFTCAAVQCFARGGVFACTAHKYSARVLQTRDS